MKRIMFFEINFRKASNYASENSLYCNKNIIALTKKEKDSKHFMIFRLKFWSKIKKITFSKIDLRNNVILFKT